MTTVLFIVALFACIFAVSLTVVTFGSRDKGLPALGALVLWVVCGGACYAALNTGGGSLAVKQFFASSKTGQWLVVDNSGGKTMRHWVLESGYVEAHTGGAGWQFYDAKGNLCYVAGDAFVMQILQPLPEFLKDYKKLYNIPTEAEALK